MKTVPTVHLAQVSDTVAWPLLPAEVRLALSDVAGAAREGLLAMSVAAGFAVMQAMLEAEVAAVAGLKGRHDAGRTAVRHGTGRGSVTLGRSAGAGGPTAGPRHRRARGAGGDLRALRRR